MDEADQVQEAAAALIELQGGLQAAATLLAMHAGGANTKPVAAHAPQRAHDNMAPVRRSPRLTARTVDGAPPRRSERLAAMAANHNSNSENS
ncbi:hypothetical protein SLEP1_g29150 [Rubroshorea leprosula]|uniref:Uncharacterized protein n=1 Tax=Rubroshorea leprosula TaxID=152421 RepID=A0AAV5JVY6_9ROSI|nr:hypothetical protein SLEP1_g29150 [Rubroshorea leprosula]